MLRRHRPRIRRYGFIFLVVNRVRIGSLGFELSFGSAFTTKEESGTRGENGDSSLLAPGELGESSWLIFELSDLVDDWICHRILPSE